MAWNVELEPRQCTKPQRCYLNGEIRKYHETPELFRNWDREDAALALSLFKKYDDLEKETLVACKNLEGT